MQELKRKLW